MVSGRLPQDPVATEPYMAKNTKHQPSFACSYNEQDSTSE